MLLIAFNWMKKKSGSKSDPVFKVHDEDARIWLAVVSGAVFALILTLLATLIVFSVRINDLSERLNQINRGQSERRNK